MGVSNIKIYIFDTIIYPTPFPRKWSAHKSARKFDLTYKIWSEGFKVDVKPGAFAGKSVMEYFTFCVKAHDKRGKPLTVGGAKIKCSVSLPDGSVCNKTQLQDCNNGTYIITFHTPVPGKYKVETTIDGKPIVGNPFTTHIA